MTYNIINYSSFENFDNENIKREILLSGCIELITLYNHFLCVKTSFSSITRRKSNTNYFLDNLFITSQELIDFIPNIIMYSKIDNSILAYIKECTENILCFYSTNFESMFDFHYTNNFIINSIKTIESSRHITLVSDSFNDYLNKSKKYFESYEESYNIGNSSLAFKKLSKLLLLIVNRVLDILSSLILFCNIKGLGYYYSKLNIYINDFKNKDYTF